MSLSLSCLPERLVCAVTEADEEDAPAVPAPRMTPPASVSPPPDDRQLADAKLVQRMAAGDRQAFSELYDRFSGPLHAMALRILHDPAESKDVLHDAFIALWEKAATFEPARGSAFSWAVTLVRNRAIDRVRMRRRRADLLAETAPDDLGYSATGAPADETAALGDEAARVRAAVAKLPLEQKHALELAFFGGLTQEEIARTLQQPLGTVKARIRRGLLKLRDALAPRL
jgi:RNA polymerase sigma-70 factor (ECF subfamily)